MSTSTASALALAAAGLLFAACQESARHASVAPATASEQVERGSQLFAASCAKCHGDAGEGSEDAPRLVGEGALPLDPRPGQKRAGQFHTAMDVATFVTQNMPPKASARAELSTEDYFAILAFALKANGVDLKEPVGASNAASFVLHP